MNLPPPAAAPAPLTRRFIAFLGPLVLTNVLQALSGTFNSVFLGQMLGPHALAAAIAFFPVFMTLFAFVIGLGTGASILVGQAWGARQTEKVRDIAGTVLLGGAALGTAIAVAGWWVAGPLLRGLGTPAEVLPDAIAYAHVMLLAMPVLFLSMLAAALLRGMGDTVTPLGVLIVTCAVSAVLTPLIISGRLGLPPQGTASAAWGTLVATTVALMSVIATTSSIVVIPQLLYMLVGMSVACARLYAPAAPSASRATHRRPQDAQPAPLKPRWEIPAWPSPTSVSTTSTRSNRGACI